MSAALMIRKTAAAAAAVCLLCAGVGSVYASSDNPGDYPVIPVTDEDKVYEKAGFRYTLPGDDTAKLVGCTLEDSDTLIIPAEIDGWKVSVIGKGLLGAGMSFDTVVFPSTVTKIESHAISGADVKTVVLPAGLTDIPEDAICTARTNKAYADYLRTLGSGDTGELDIVGEMGIVKPVGELLTVRCSVGSAGAAYADKIGAAKQLMSGYAGRAGDIDCNKVINNRDLKQLQKYINGSDTEHFTPSYDVDGNGVIDENDIRHLQKRLVGETVTIY